MFKSLCKAFLKIVNSSALPMKLVLYLWYERFRCFLSVPQPVLHPGWGMLSRGDGTGFGQQVPALWLPKEPSPYLPQILIKSRKVWEHLFQHRKCICLLHTDLNWKRKNLQLSQYVCLNLNQRHEEHFSLKSFASKVTGEGFIFCFLIHCLHLTLQ